LSQSLTPVRFCPLLFLYFDIKILAIFDKENSTQIWGEYISFFSSLQENFHQVRYISKNSMEEFDVYDNPIHAHTP